MGPWLASITSLPLNQSDFSRNRETGETAKPRNRGQAGMGSVAPGPYPSSVRGTVPGVRIDLSAVLRMHSHSQYRASERCSYWR